MQIKCKLIFLAVYLHFISIQSMAEQLAENYHNTWGRKKKMELQTKGMMSLFETAGNINPMENLNFLRFFS